MYPLTYTDGYILLLFCFPMTDPCLATVSMHVSFWCVRFSLGWVLSSGLAVFKGRCLYSVVIFTAILLPKVSVSHYFLLPVCESSSLFTPVTVRFATLCICRLNLRFLYSWCGRASRPICTGPYGFFFSAFPLLAPFFHAVGLSFTFYELFTFSSCQFFVE